MRLAETAGIVNMAGFEGKVALVTGAGRQRGIGRAAACRLAREGAFVVVSARPRDTSSFPPHERATGWRGAQSVVDEIVAAGGQALALPCDVSQPEQVDAMVTQIMNSCGRLDILVNNAGVPSEAGAAPIIGLDERLWHETIDINLTGVFRVSKACAAQMINAGKGGAIVNVSSMAGRKGMPNLGAYCASKFGVIGLTQQMAAELAGHGIRVNAICPGATDTDMVDGTYRRLATAAKMEREAMLAAAVATIPMGRQGKVEEQAAAISFLAGPDASYITGQTLNVDGGACMR
ncbi:SDR family oxidoreductase [Sphingobium sp. JS3065]|uniref:SDR family NAD(P)-dependent oxidoreductase n=1 Tax=Sphingobium sp. JS3065 TaxID=2970925 RepID=UPI002263F700|nr:SDR family NAD(P)-dependent oxidoreductase [Sphingobium sp. JS3065]UZW56411.1 SDR family oxidoreductase [Sphingobium sp. JS3065]